MPESVSILPFKAPKLWDPDPYQATNINKFIRFVKSSLGLHIENYDELYSWSIQNYAEFWSAWWNFGGFIHSSPALSIVSKHDTIADKPKWFVGAELNFAENLLHFRDEKIAIIGTGEGILEDIYLTYSQVYEYSQRWARALRSSGVQSGDRVAGYLPNCIDAVLAMLGATTLGAVWCSASPDFGVKGVVDRFLQVRPSVLVSVEAVFYNGKVHDNLAKLQSVVELLPSVKHTVVCPFVKTNENIDISDVPNSILREDFLLTNDNSEVPFEQVPFNHPAFIMFSSGTTGAPKCIVHGVGGTLIQITKEHVLHCNISREDVFTYYTTTGWMMWQWLVTGLYSGCSLLLYDGSPLSPHPAVIWDIVDKHGVTVLGTGAKWLAVLESKGVRPIETHSLSSLRCILSTGSPLTNKSFQFVYKQIKKNVMLGSISGGTDIISCFMGCCPLLPVHEGEVQCRLLGMGIEVWDPEGRPIYDAPGELVCTVPFPSMPTHFWGDTEGLKYHKAYFAKFEGIWHHGDYCILHSSTGGLSMLGRSDGTLNPNGVRFGSSEIYALVEQFPAVADSVCIGHRKRGDGEERVILFLKMREGEEFTPSLQAQLVSLIRKELSVRHVPAVMLPVEDIPYTVSGKKVEVAVRQVVHGEQVANRNALANPSSLDLFRNIPQLQGWS